MKQELATIISNRELMPEVHLVWLESKNIAASAIPGQFVMVHCGSGTEHMLRRPLSIHQTDGNRLAMLFSVIGKGTDWLAQCKSDDKLDIIGPLGNGFKVEDGARKLLLVAGGIGIAPLRLLADYALSKGHSVKLLLGAATASCLYPKESLPADLELVITTEDGTAGKKGMITDLLPEHISQADQIFACGPVRMYHTLIKRYGTILEAKPVQVSLEVRMGCGHGVCYGCTVKTQNGLKLVCADGPVFELKDIDWDGITSLM